MILTMIFDRNQKALRQRCLATPAYLSIYDLVGSSDEELTAYKVFVPYPTFL